MKELQKTTGLPFLRLLALAALSLAMLPLADMPLHAFGFGFYGSAGTGPTPLTIRSSPQHRDDGLGFGLLLDTAVGRNELVNYRAHIGYENLINKGAGFFSRYGMHRAYFANTFGFGVVRKKGARFWIGPQVAFSCVYKDLSTSYRFRGGYAPGTLYYRADSYRFIIPMMSFGAVFGVNINLGDNFAFGIEAGFHTGMGVGPYRYTMRNLYIFSTPMFGTRVLPVRESVSKDYEYFKFEVSAKVSMIFRVGDAYRAEAPDNGREDKPSGEERLRGVIEKNTAEGEYKK